MKRLSGWFLKVLMLPLLYGGAAAAQHPMDVQRRAAEGKYLEALTLYDKLPRRQVTAAAAAAAGKAAWALSLPDRAIDEFDKALRDHNLNKAERGRLLLSRGIIEYQEGRFQTAVLFAEKALGSLTQASPLQAKAWLLWGESLVKLGSFGAAEDKYRKALAMSLPAERPEIHFLLGMCQVKLGRLKEARANFEQVPLEHPRTAQAVRELAALALDQGQYAQAAFWLKKGRSDFPDDFLDSWVDYAMLRTAVELKDAQQVERIKAAAQEKYPPSDQWLTLLNAAAESFAWEKGSRKEAR